MNSRGDERKRGRVRRRNVDVGDGWTVVTHGMETMRLEGKSGGLEVRQPHAAIGKDGEGDMMRAPGIIPDLTVEKLLAEFRVLQKRWEEMAVARQVREVVSKRKGNVENAVCLGIGSFSREWENRWRSLWQLVLFVDVVAHLQSARATSPPGSTIGDGDEKAKGGISLHAQDPFLTPLDIAFLVHLHITTHNTGIETHVTPSTFLYSPFVDWYVLLPTFLAAPGQDPVLYVGNEVLENYDVYAQTREKRDRLDECNAIGKRFLGNRKERVRLVEGEGDAGCRGAVGGMIVAWRVEEREL